MGCGKNASSNADHFPSRVEEQFELYSNEAIVSSTIASVLTQIHLYEYDTTNWWFDASIVQLRRDI